MAHSAVLSLVVIGLVVATSAVVIEIDDLVEKELGKMNGRLRTAGITMVSVPEYNFEGYNTSHSAGYILGIDSLYRSGKCSINVTSEGLVFDYHIGFEFVAGLYSRSTINDRNMTGYYRAKDLSCHVTFTVVPFWKSHGKCHLFLNTNEIERFTGVTLYSSDPEFDNTDVSSFYDNVVRQVINEKIEQKNEEIEKVLHSFCGKSLAEMASNLYDLLKKLLHHNF